MADWRSSFQNWTTLLPLLVSQNEKKKIYIIYFDVLYNLSLKFLMWDLEKDGVPFDWTEVKQAGRY